MNANDFNPDWSIVCTAEEAEVKLSISFKGPGWYLEKDETLLAIPFESIGPVDIPWASSSPPETKFHFYIWNHNKAIHAFNTIYRAPTRDDAR